MKPYNKTNKSKYGVILLTFVIALFLAVIPYPAWMQDAIPAWVTLVIFYWCMALPHRIGVGTGWVVGLILDLLHHTLLGHHAIAKAFVAMIAIGAHQRLRMYHLWQQCIVIFIVSIIELLLVFWIYQVTSDAQFQISYWQSAFTTALLWPVVYTVLRFVRQRNNIS